MSYIPRSFNIGGSCDCCNVTFRDVALGPCPWSPRAIIPSVPWMPPMIINPTIPFANPITVPGTMPSYFSPAMGGLPATGL